MNKTKVIILRCTIGEKKIIQQLSKKCGLKLSEYCRRQAIHGEVKAIPVLTQEEIDYFRLLKTYCTHFDRCIKNFGSNDLSCVILCKLRIIYHID